MHRSHRPRLVLDRSFPTGNRPAWAMVLSVLLLGSVGWDGAMAQPAPTPDRMANPYLEVTFDPGTRTTRVSSQVSGRTFLRDIGFADPPVSSRIDPADPSPFGPGRTMILAGASGTVHRVYVYDALPFVLLQTTIRNPDPQASVLRRYPAYAFALDLGRAPGDLRAFGTAGLTGVDRESQAGSYGFLSVVDPGQRSGVVAGWLTSERGCGVLFSDAVEGEVSLQARIDFGALQVDAGQEETLETLAIGWFEDARLGLEAYADAVARHYHIRLPPQPTVYCTWYHAGASNQRDLLANASFAHEQLQPFGFSVVQIDDKWQAGQSDNGPRKNFTAHRADGPYPDGMKAVADGIKALGLTPGLWYMPFAGTHDDPFFADKQDMFATQDGRPFDTRWGGTCLDLTHPRTREYVYDVARRITRDWGFQYLKLDGLFTGAAVRQMYVNDRFRDDELGESRLHDPTMTHIQAFRTGLQIVRRAAGEDVFLLGCNTPQNMRTLVSSMGLVDAMRIGPDNGRSWDRMLRGPTFGSRHYFLHGRVWYNDPDPIYVRQKDVPLDQARTLVSWVTLSGQLNASSCDYTELAPDRIDLLRRSMPAHDLRPRPADLFEQAIPRVWTLADDRTGVDRRVIGVFNWDGDSPAEVEYELVRMGLEADRDYVGFDYWGDRFVDPFRGRLRTPLPPAGCRVLAVRPVLARPQLLGTSRHITQGILDVTKEGWNPDTRALSGTSALVGGDPYELRIVAMGDGLPWRMESVSVSPEDRAAGVEVVRSVQDGPQVRVTLASRAARRVDWSVAFSPPPGS